MRMPVSAVVCISHTAPHSKSFGISNCCQCQCHCQCRSLYFQSRNHVWKTTNKSLHLWYDSECLTLSTRSICKHQQTAYAIIKSPSHYSSEINSTPRMKT